MTDLTARVAVAYADLPGWDADDHRAALGAFLVTVPLLAPSDAYPASLMQRIGVAAADAWRAVENQAARQFFEQHFVPHRVSPAGLNGFVTGYYEPVLPGARNRSAAFPVAIYKRPPDLINVVSEADRGASAVPFTHLRRTATGTEPYATRADIETGALAGQGLELLYLADPVDAFFLQVQGSGLITFGDGTSLRVTYDGKNGHPYTSIGRVLIERGLVSALEMTLDTLATWLRANPDQAAAVMRENKSYVFFRALTGADARAPQGVMGVTLTEGRSLAVDTAFQTLGMPVFLHAPTLADDKGAAGFNRLMIAQDVGSAIKGPERGDIYFGSGPAAGARAGVTKHTCSFFSLLPERWVP
jgi:membrane-bound lytic murein transglycosylase A